VIGGDKPVVVVTGIAGNLGSRLLPLLEDFRVIGVDISPPLGVALFRFQNIDLGHEAACRQLVNIFKETPPQAVVHLAAVVDPLRSGVVDVARMWQVNVAGTARVMEAITEFNRHGGSISTFVFPSSASVYGPETHGAVKETHALHAHTLQHAVHKREADEVVRFRSESLGDCTTYVLRAHIFAGTGAQNYTLELLGGTPSGKSKRAHRMRNEGKRIHMLLPGKKYMSTRVQFVHVEDLARLVAHILHRPVTRENEVKIFNVAGRGDPITLNDAAAIANARVMQVPGKWTVRLIMAALWRMGISGVPPAALPYLVGSCLVDTSKLKQFLGDEYEKVIRYTVSTALLDSFKPEGLRAVRASGSV
jgi:nucleoside-diphosphate-sugar epimerase